MNRHQGVLWIGSLMPYMTETFLRNALSLMGEADSLCLVKIAKNKFTGASSPHGFLQFNSDATALMVMHKLNGKIIPNSQPPVTFQLNHGGGGGGGGSDREFSVWVSKLPKDVTEDEFRKTFATRYESLKTCKLLRETDGELFGFLRFGNLNDQREALIHMDGFAGLGGGEKPIMVSMAVPKPCLSHQSAATVAEKQPREDGHDRGTSSWQRAPPPPLLAGSGALKVSGGGVAIDWDLLAIDGDSEDDDRLIEYDAPINVDAMNAEFVERSREVWDAAEGDRWIYNLDNDVGGIVPDDVNNEKSLKRKVQDDTYRPTSSDLLL